MPHWFVPSTALFKAGIITSHASDGTLQDSVFFGGIRKYLSGEMFWIIKWQFGTGADIIAFMHKLVDRRQAGVWAWRWGEFKTCQPVFWGWTMENWRGSLAWGWLWSSGQNRGEQAVLHNQTVSSAVHSLLAARERAITLLNFLRIWLPECQLNEDRQDPWECGGAIYKECAILMGRLYIFVFGKRRSSGRTNVWPRIGLMFQSSGRVASSRSGFLWNLDQYWIWHLQCASAISKMDSGWWYCSTISEKELKNMESHIPLWEGFQVFGKRKVVHGSQ